MEINMKDTLREVLKGEEGIEACQNYIVSLLVSAAQTAQIMLTKTKFAPIEEIAAYEFGIQLMKLLFEDDNVGFYANGILCAIPILPAITQSLGM